MLPRFDAAVMPVRPADGIGAGAAVGEERQVAFQRAMQSMVGQSVTAEVMSRFKDGSSLVKVADNAVRMMLPPGVNVGDQVPLTVLSASPRPTFQLGTGTPGASPTVVYSEGAATEGGEALYSPSLPSQQAAGQPAGTGRPPAAAVPGEPGRPAQAEAGAAADPDAVPGQARPGVAPGGPAAQPATQPAVARPGTEAAQAAAAQGKPADAAAAGPAGRALPTAAGQPAAAQAAQAAGTPLPADAVKPQSLAATLLGKAPLTPSSELPELDHTTPQSTLSNTARVLTTVLTTAQSGQVAQLALIGKTALLGSGLPDTDALAQKLHDTISKSGLFYESHVTEWVKGERTLPELMREPQMQRMAQAGEQTAARAAANGPDLTAAQMINQQLHTHEQGRVQWQGEAWPGQPMQWDVRREQREKGKQDGGAGDDTPEQIWRSGVRFRFPLLGEVSASVTLVGDQVHIQVQTGSDGTADTLRTNAGRLEQAMEAAGAPLSSLLITQDNGGGDGG